MGAVSTVVSGVGAHELGARFPSTSIMPRPAASARTIPPCPGFALCSTHPARLHPLDAAPITLSGEP